MNVKKFPIGVLQGRLTPTKGRGIQFFPNLDDEWEKEFVAASSIGLDAIEILVRPESFKDGHPLLSSEGIKKIKNLSSKYSIKTPSIHAYYSLSPSYENELVAIIKAADNIGAKTVLISFFKERKLSPKKDESWERAIVFINKALKQTENSFVRLGIEAELPAQTLLDFINCSAFPKRLGIYYDIGNQFACGFPVTEEMLLLRDKIFGVHLKDRLIQIKNEPESPSVPFGKGCANFEIALKKLKEIGYDGSLIIQGARKEDNKEIETVLEYKLYIENIINKI